MGFTTILPKPDWGIPSSNVDPAEWYEDDDKD